MKKFILIALMAFSFSAIAQTTPTNKTRSDGAFTQVDQYLNVIKRLGVPTAESDALAAGGTSQNTVKLFYNSGLGKLRIYDPVTSQYKDATPVDLSAYALDENVLHKNGNETKYGNLNLVNDLSVNGNAFNLNAPLYSSNYAIFSESGDLYGKISYGVGDIGNFGFNHLTNKFNFNRGADFGGALKSHIAIDNFTELKHDRLTRTFGSNVYDFILPTDAGGTLATLERTIQTGTHYQSGKRFTLTEENDAVRASYTGYGIYSTFGKLLFEPNSVEAVYDNTFRFNKSGTTNRIYINDNEISRSHDAKKVLWGNSENNITDLGVTNLSLNSPQFYTSNFEIAAFKDGILGLAQNSSLPFPRLYPFGGGSYQKGIIWLDGTKNGENGGIQIGLGNGDVAPTEQGNLGSTSGADFRMYSGNGIRLQANAGNKSNDTDVAISIGILGGESIGVLKNGVVKISLTEYASNAAAIAAGLTPGSLYKTSGSIKIVE